MLLRALKRFLKTLRKNLFKTQFYTSAFTAKFHYTGPTGPDRTRTDFFAARISEKLRWVRAGLRQSPCGSGRVRVVEFTLYASVHVGREHACMRCGSVWLAVRDGMYLFIDLADNDRTHTAPAAASTSLSLLHRGLSQHVIDR